MASSFALGKCNGYLAHRLLFWAFIHNSCPHTSEDGTYHVHERSNWVDQMVSKSTS